MQNLPNGAPVNLQEAFAHVSSATTPSIEVLQTMVLVEAASKQLYESLAASVSQPAIRELLLTNAREELAHAHRVSRAIGHLTGINYPVPSPAENPYLTGPIPKREISAPLLAALAKTELAGNDVYAAWAQNCVNKEAAELFLQNGREENNHAHRLQLAAELLPQ